jgi:hypothetical protein
MTIKFNRMTEPKLIKAGDKRVLLGYVEMPPKVDVRVIAEDNYQELKQAFDLYNVGRSFIEELIDKENTLKNKLSENLTLYLKLEKMELYDQTFSQWNKCNLVLWDLKDILCRMGKDID